MRIGILTYDFRPAIGGLGIVAGQLVLQLQKDFPANEYVVFSPSPGAVEPVSRLARWRWGKRGGCPIFSLSLLWTLTTMLKRRHIDVLHVHAGSGGVWLLRKPRCPLVVTAHHSYAQEAQAVFQRSPFTAAWKRLMGVLERRTYRFADHITCVSEDTRRVLVSVYGIPAERISVVENAVDLEHFTPHPAVHRHPKTVLFAGRMEPRKGIWVFLRAMSAIHTAVPDAQFRFIGENLVGRRLHTLLKQMKLTRASTILGRLHEPLLVREMCTAAVVVVPSLVEGFGLIAAEAMACGTCVVASDCDGLRSILKNSQTGMLFPTGDARACAAAVSMVLLDPALRDRLAAAGMADARKRFAFGRQAAEMQACFDSVKRASKK